MSFLSFFEIGSPCAAYAGLEVVAVCLRLFWVLGFQAVLHSGSFPFSSVSLLPTTGWTGLLHRLLSHDAPCCHSPNLTRKSDSGWQPGELPYQALPLEVVYLGYSVSAKQTYAFKSYLTWELLLFFFLLHSFVVCVWGQLTPCARVEVREDSCGSQVSPTSKPEDWTLDAGLGGKHLAGPHQHYCKWCACADQFYINLTQAKKYPRDENLKKMPP